MKNKKIQKLQDEIVEWSNKTFGTEFTRPIGVVNHLKEEVNEVLVEVKELVEREDCTIDKLKSEVVDCLMLLLDLSGKFEITVEDLIYGMQEKLEINKKRKWGKLENGYSKHIKDGTKS